MHRYVTGYDVVTENTALASIEIGFKVSNPVILF